MARIPHGLLVITLGTTIFGVGYGILLRPELIKLNQESARYDLVNEQVAESASAQSDAEIQAQADKVYALLPTESDLFALSVAIENLGKTVPVTLTGLTVTPASESAGTSSQTAKSKGIQLPDGVKSSQLSISLTAGYAQAQEFVKGLTALARYISVQDITITGDPESEIVTMQINALTFSLP